MGVGLAVDVAERVRGHGAERVADPVAQLSEPRVPARKGALDLGHHQVAVALDVQLRCAVVDRALYTKQQRRVLGSVVGLAAARHVVRARPHHGTTGCEERGACSTGARVASACAVKAQQPCRVFSRASVQAHRYCRFLLHW
ncbi:hypothetical protein Pcac1_g28577 [Phytophthora cactorum]|nr:hypothetical protein Pcac1_g28577 [Phytophthora cactorum]